jgi:hypothetical protein
MKSSQLTLAAVAALTLIVVAAAAAPASRPAREAAAREQSTLLISRALDGGVPNGASTNAVISGDKRFARAIAFESDASNLVPGDTNGVKDVFVALRAGPIGNTGSPWRPQRTVLVSRPRSGGLANGASFSPSIGGSFHHPPTCVGFLSSATNLVPGDANGKVDAFVATLAGGVLRRVSMPGGHEATDDTTAVAVSGDCKLVAFVTAGKLYVANGSSVHAINAPGVASDPSFSTGLRNDLVFAAQGGVYLAKNGTGRPRLVAPGGRNPAYNDIKRQVVTYEVTRNGHAQIAYRDLGKREQIISAHRGALGNGDSTNPVIGNAGFYVTFETDATNLGTNATGNTGDGNAKPDVYLYTNVRKITLVQSVEQKAVPLPGGGKNPSMSFYANYVVFDSPAPVGNPDAPHQVYMRYLGGI